MYLDFIKLYGSLHAAKGAELFGARDRLLGGIHKLQDTNAAVDKMQQQLNSLQPLLAEKTEVTEKLLVQVSTRLGT
jgi:dynein heavy chain